jgi:hypothetical protein
MLLRGLMTSRGEPGDELDDGDMVFVTDNCEHHHLPALMKCFINDGGNPVPKKIKLIYVMYDEDSLRQRKGCVRPGTSFDCVEHMNIVTKNDFTQTLPHCKRLHYGGSNISNKIGDVVLANYEALWSLPCKLKYDIHGAFRIACGGPTADEEGPGRGNKRKTVHTVEPVFWRGRPVKFYQTLISDYKLEKGIIDLTAGDGTFMIHCAKERIPYLGFTLSEAHSKALKQRATQMLLKSMFTAGDRLYNPELALLMKAPGGATPSGSAGSNKPAAEKRTAEQELVVHPPCWMSSRLSSPLSRS